MKGAEVWTRPVLRLFSRSYCHLCEDMRTALEKLHGEYVFSLEVFDVDADPLLESRYDELVPVVEADGRELCRYRIDEAVVRAYLASFR